MLFHILLQPLNLRWRSSAAHSNPSMLSLGSLPAGEDRGKPSGQGLNLAGGQKATARQRRTSHQQTAHTDTVLRLPRPLHPHYS
jgi:hypothetical protein